MESSTDGEATFLDFVVRTLESADGIESAIVVYRKDDGTIGYKTFNQQVADTLGILRFVGLSVENELVSGWRDNA